MAFNRCPGGVCGDSAYPGGELKLTDFNLLLSGLTMSLRVGLYPVENSLCNLALMKLSTWAKSQGHKTKLMTDINTRWGSVQYFSVLYKWHKHLLPDWGIKGGPGYDPKIALPDDVERCSPDYSLYPKNLASWGYSFKSCGRHCEFCVVGKNPQNKDTRHYSILEWVNPEFNSIVLLNNNTLADPFCIETFKEIKSLGLAVFDLNGYDLRLLNDEHLAYMEKLYWATYIHFAWDRMKDEEEIMKGLEILRRSKLKRKSCVYVLCGFRTTFKQDLYRINKLRDMGIKALALMYSPHDRLQRRLHAWTLRADLFFKIPWEDFKYKNELRKERMTDEEKEKEKAIKTFRNSSRRNVLRGKLTD